MRSKGMLLTAVGCFGAIVVLGQAPAPAPPALQHGPGVQAAQDSGYQEWITTKCKNPPAARGGGAGRGAGGAGAAAGAAAAGQRAAAGAGGGAGRGDGAAGGGRGAANATAGP